jgi:hypothetical protein
MAIHLCKYRHGNTSPVEGVDFFYDQRRSRTPRIPVFYGNVVVKVATVKQQQPQGAYRCMHCGGSRQFIFNGVTSHLKDKYISILQYLSTLLTAPFLRHKIISPVMDRDMKKI